MKLFLSSSFSNSSKTFKKTFGNLKKQKVIFVANASDDDEVAEEEKWWIIHDRNVFLKLGWEVIDADLRSISKKDFLKLLKTSDFIHFCGGSVFYVMALIKNRGFTKPIFNAVKDGLVYTGSSAGSMIVAKDLTLDSFDPDEKDYIGLMNENYTGLGLVDFLILPHSDSKYFVKSNIITVGKIPEVEYQQPVILLSDGHTVLVEGDEVSLLK